MHLGIYQTNCKFVKLNKFLTFKIVISAKPAYKRAACTTGLHHNNGWFILSGAFEPGQC